MLTTCSRPITMSHMPSKSIPRFFVRFMLFTSFCSEIFSFILRLALPIAPL